jgi:hypothetical protein
MDDWRRQGVAESARQALERALFSLGEAVGRAGRRAHEDPRNTEPVSDLRGAHWEVESAILAAMAVSHNYGAAPQGVAPLLGFHWDRWEEANRQRFNELWGDIQADASNVGEPDLHKRLRELWVVMD